MANTKLELTWIGKNEPLKIEPRILVENPELSNNSLEHNISTKVTLFDTGLVDNFDNMLIHGDNLLALKALEQKYAGKVKQIYIDPPYNTGYAFTHYDDNLEHSTWLNLMKPRLEILKNLLTLDGGTIWISIDADEHAYLKVLCDEVFGRKNFVDEIVWQRSYAPVNLKKTLSRSHDYILVYAKNYDASFCLNKLPRSSEANDRYRNLDNDPRGVWKSSDCSVGPVVEDKLYEIVTPSGRVITPPLGRCWLYTKERFEEMVADNRIWFGPNGDSVPSVKKFLSEVRDGIVAQTMWGYEEVGHTQDAKKEVKALNLGAVFDTPKPEHLMQRIIMLGSNPGDLVLDSFLGSGTTCAVAHKMGRKWIGIEMGEHAYSYCKARLNMVIDGSDQGGVSKELNWHGGGGYRFYELAPSLIVKDRFDNYVINKEYNADMLASAMALHEGFEYIPDGEIYWKQGKNENAYIFTTTQHITLEYLAGISAEMNEGEYLIIACKSFDAGADRAFKNIKIKKIPQMLLGRCEFGKDNYDLNIINPPLTDDEEGDDE